MKDILEELPKPTTGNKAIYILHDPPADVGLDYCRDGAKPGSKDIYKFLENSNAYMSLHGHIHESYSLSKKWKAKIGNTIAVQAGQSELNEDYFVYVVVDTDNNICERYVINWK